MRKDGIATKASIEKEALRLFVEKGVDATTMRDIAAAAGIQTGSTYVHYKSKEILVWELFAKGYHSYGLKLKELADSGVTVQEKIDHIVHGLCALFDEDSTLFSFVLLVQHGQIKKLTPDLCNPVQVMCGVISAGMEKGEIPRRDPVMVTAMIMGVVLQTATFKVYGRLNVTFRDMAEDLSAACLRVIQ